MEKVIGQKTLNWKKVRTFPIEIEKHLGKSNDNFKFVLFFKIIFK